MRPRFDRFAAFLCLPLLTLADPVHAQSSAEYTVFLNFCAQQGGDVSGTPSNPVSFPAAQLRRAIPHPTQPCSASPELLAAR